MKLGLLAAAAAISMAGVTGASAQVYIQESYVANAYAPPPVYVAPDPPPVYVTPAPVYAAPAPVVVEERVYAAPAPIGRYVAPKYTYTINTPRYGVVTTGYREPGGCAIGPDGYCY